MYFSRGMFIRVSAFFFFDRTVNNQSKHKLSIEGNMELIHKVVCTETNNPAVAENSLFADKSYITEFSTLKEFTDYVDDNRLLHLYEPTTKFDDLRTGHVGSLNGLPVIVEQLKTLPVHKQTFTVSFPTQPHIPNKKVDLTELLNVNN